MRLQPEEVKTLERVSRQFPEFVELLSRWRAEELELLPVATGASQNLNVLQGRVQVLTELRKHLSSHA